MAHNNYMQLNRLICSLDNEKVDVFLHIDRRSEAFNVPTLKYSRIIEIPRTRTNWGGISLVKCELNLLQEALKTDNYSFFHLLSGQDLLIKPLAYVLEFFDRNSKYNFVHFDCPEKSLRRYERVKYWFPFQDGIGRKGTKFPISKVIVGLEKLIHIDRTRSTDYVFKAGSQWWSIKKDLAEYVVNKREIIYKLFKYTMCDEMFIQTLVYNSSFYDSLYIKEKDDCHGNQRLIVFSQGTPCVWKKQDFQALIQSDLLIARKFDERVDNTIIDLIYNYCNP